MESRTVLQYQLLERIGSGGMGDVYKAQDTRLNRIVAIKVLPDDKSGESERRRRFLQEAQAASALNHPNIITIHDIVSDNGVEYMVMEYVKGKTLMELIPQDGMRVPQVIKYSLQMADALGAAHEAGIIHRDLKPGNVMVKDSGLVKILDFGLAKLTDPTSQFTDGETVDAPLTVEGSIIGTVSYMSPEQAQGKRVDVRSDIFSFGSVVYEMLTGRKAFQGDSNIATIFAVVRDELRPISTIAPDVPPQIEQVITRCLRKDPDARWQSMKEVQTALSALKDQSDSGVLYRTQITQIPELKPSASPSSRKAMGLAILGVLFAAVAIGAGGWWWMTQRKPAVPPPISQPSNAAIPEPVRPSPFDKPPPQPATPPVAVAPVPAILTNDGVVDMVKAKLPVSVIIRQIKASKTNFDLSTPAIIRLTNAGVPESVMEVMRNPTGAAGAAGVASQAPATKTGPQTATPANTSVAVTVSDGTPFPIILTEDIPADAEQGRILRFTAVDAVRAGDAVVIAKGAAVTGAIIDANKKKFLGMGGKMTFRLLEVAAVDGQKLKVRAMPSKRSDAAARRPVEIPGGGRSKEVAATEGSRYIAYIDGLQTVSLSK